MAETSQALRLTQYAMSALATIILNQILDLKQFVFIIRIKSCIIVYLTRQR